jgi:hypothetical protein
VAWYTLGNLKRKTMKMKIVNAIGRMALLAGLVVSPVLLASNSADVEKTLAGSSISELPSNAANLVASAAPTEKDSVAVAAVRASVGLNPSAVVSIVSAVVAKNPASAVSVAVTAAQLQPKRIGLIAKAAATAAPSQAGRIVKALLKQSPQDYGVVAHGASLGAPSASREILAAVADSIPALQAPIQSLTAQYSADSALPVQPILTQSYSQATSSGAVVRFAAPAVASTTTAAVSGPQISGPTLGPPFTGSTTTPTSYSPSSTGQEQPGGRGYASP